MAIILWYRRIERKSRNWACGVDQSLPQLRSADATQPPRCVLNQECFSFRFRAGQKEQVRRETVCQYSSSKWEPPSLLHHVACLFFSGNCQFCSPQQLQYFSTKRSVLQLYPDCLCKAIKQVQESRLCTLRGRGSTIAHHACRVYSGA